MHVISVKSSCMYVVHKRGIAQISFRVENDFKYSNCYYRGIFSTFTLGPQWLCTFTMDTFAYFPVCVHAYVCEMEYTHIKTSPFLTTWFSWCLEALNFNAVCFSFKYTQPHFVSVTSNLIRQKTNFKTTCL